MEVNQGEKKSLCKFCGKRFTSSRILNSHIKSHFLENSCKEDTLIQGNLEKPTKVSSFHKCSVCSKKFDSPRALFGHMRHHSGARKSPIRCKECGRRFRYERSFSNHQRKMHPVAIFPEVSDQPGSSSSGFSLVWRKRSRTSRYRKTSASVFGMFCDSLSVIENEQEVEVAECLLMLSTGIGCFDKSNPVGDFSDNKSLTSEANSSEQQRGKLYGEAEPKRRRLDDEMKRAVEVELSQNLIEEVGTMESNPFECASFDACDAAALNISTNSDPKGEHRCRSCDKVFPSPQALGGHQTFHRTSKMRSGKCQESLQLDIVPAAKMETEIIELEGINSSTKYKCTTCLRAFATGQALVGHTKCHRAKTSSGQKGKKEKILAARDVIDLNFPAMIDEETTGDTEL